MSFTVIATDRTGKVVKTYKSKESAEALGLVALLTEKGFTAQISEGPIKKRKNPATRKNVHMGDPGWEEMGEGAEEFAPDGLTGEESKVWAVAFGNAMKRLTDQALPLKAAQGRASGIAMRAVGRFQDKVRSNPGELLILSGFTMNPTRKNRGSLPDVVFQDPKTLIDDHDLEEMADAFREFHAGAKMVDILQMPDDAVPPSAKHLFVLGELVSIVYEVPSHSGKAPGAPFRHFLGEVGHSSKVVKKNRPLLCGTTDGKYLVIVHRNKPGSKNTYRVRSEGIIG